MEYVVLAALFIAGFTLVFLVLRRIVNRWFESQAQLEKIQQEVEKMLIELNHAAGRNVDLIEERIRELKETLALVDKRIGLLRREEEKHEMGKNVYNKILMSVPAVACEKTKIEETPSINIRDRILNLYHSGFSSTMIANQLGKSVGEVELVISLSEKD